MYICIEGPDGSGKTSLIDALKKEYQEALFIREPGSTDFAENLRNICLHSEYNINQLSELLLIFAARSDLVDKVVIPSVNNKLIFSDRSFISSYAYQIYPRLKKSNDDKLLNDLFNNLVISAQQGCYADILIYLDVDYSNALPRIMSRTLSIDNIEKKGNDYFQLVNQGYNYYLNNVILSNAICIEGNSVYKRYTTNIYNKETIVIIIDSNTVSLDNIISTVLSFFSGIFNDK